jgi:hypothetical protein
MLITLQLALDLTHVSGAWGRRLGVIVGSLCFNKGSGMRAMLLASS